MSHAHKSTIDNTPPFCRIVLDRCMYFSAWLDPVFGISLGVQAGRCLPRNTGHSHELLTEP